MDFKDLYKKASSFADQKINNIKDDHWDNQSICSEWSVRDLVNHLVYENLWVGELLAGKTVAEVGDKLDGDLLGEDPKAAWGQSNSEALETVEDLGDTEKIVHLSFGDVPASEYLNQLILDKAIHGWDVAVSTGQDDEIPKELVDYLYKEVKEREDEFETYGVFAKRVEVSDDAPLQTKLLAILGRKREKGA